MLFNMLRKNDIGEPPWDYYFLRNLDEKEYPRYLSKLFKLNTGENLPLKWDFKKRAWIIDKNRCKTFNQKIQWIKLYGVTDLMRDCTDKVKVRDYVRERIGEEYLKPVLQKIGACHFENLENQNGNSVDFQVDQNLKDAKSPKEKMLKHACIIHEIQNKKFNKTAVQHDRPISALHFNFDDVSTYFDKIDFDKLSSCFVIKCNHGCKWQYIIKDKEQFLENKRLFDIVKRNITGWLEQDYGFWGGFEMQYRNIEPKILIEPLMRDNKDKTAEEINVYCFIGEPEYVLKKYGNEKAVSIYDKNFNLSFDIFNTLEEKIDKPADELIKQTFDLSKKLAKNFIFVRVDWMIYQNKIYFEEMTFTPHSGFHNFTNKKNIKLGNLVNLEGYSNEF